MLCVCFRKSCYKARWELAIYMLFATKRVRHPCSWVFGLKVFAFANVLPSTTNEGGMCQSQWRTIGAGNRRSMLCFRFEGWEDCWMVKLPGGLDSEDFHGGL